MRVDGRFLCQLCLSLGFRDGTWIGCTARVPNRGGVAYLLSGAGSETRRDLDANYRAAEAALRFASDESGFLLVTLPAGGERGGEGAGPLRAEFFRYDGAPLHAADVPRRPIATPTSPAAAAA
eukprot:tig00000204_g17712.t1